MHKNVVSKLSNFTHRTTPQCRLAIAITLSISLHALSLLNLASHRVASSSGQTSSLRVNLRIIEQPQPPTNHQVIAKKNNSTTQQSKPPSASDNKADQRTDSEDEHFIDHRLLNPKPEFIIPPTPVHPPSEHHVAGSALLELLLDEDGNVLQAKLIRSDFDEKTNASILLTFQKHPLKPGWLDGVPVKSKVMTEYTFDNGKRGR